ncbi:MAG: hypothetical protein ABSE49_27110 [Polyangiaceae bacterium]|jgi:hypothetical protein
MARSRASSRAVVVRRWSPAAALLAAFPLGCNSTGSAVPPADAGPPDVTTDATTPPGDGGVTDAPSEAPTPSTCLDIDATLPVASFDCVYGGHCPVSCSGGTASAFLCNGGPDGAATYPGVFNPPSDPVDIVASQPGAYPWEAGAAYVSCAPLACTRWATADHVDGGSAWAGDPCADGGVATQAWACPMTPGILPTPSGCFNAGDLQIIGGPGTGLPANGVWCCPPLATPGDDGGSDAGANADAGEPGADAASE